MCATALVLPSEALDSVGYVNLGAFSIALPVSASDLPQLRELVEPGRTGLLFTSGDAASLAAALRFALENPEEMRKMGMRARDFVRDRHGMEQMLAGTLRVYERVQGQ